MTHKLRTPLLLLGLWLLIPYGHTAVEYDGTQGKTADILSRGLYCNTFDLMSGDLGIILGLLIGFLGFLTLIWNKTHYMVGVIMIIGGVCLTAVPKFFEITFQNMTVMAKDSGMDNKVFDSFYEGRIFLGDCSNYHTELTFIDMDIIIGGGNAGGIYDYEVTGSVSIGGSGSVDEMIDDIIRREGGYINHPNDNGGPTNHGITQGTLTDWLGRPATIADIQRLSESEAREIYRNKYLPNGNGVPSEVLPILFDANVNHGNGGGNTILRRAREHVGPSANGTELYTAFVNARAAYYVNILRNDKKQASFGNGWNNRMKEFGYNGPHICQRAGNSGCG